MNSNQITKTFTGLYRSHRVVLCAFVALVTLIPVQRTLAFSCSESVVSQHNRFISGHKCQGTGKPCRSYPSYTTIPTHQKGKWPLFLFPNDIDNISTDNTPRKKNHRSKEKVSVRHASFKSRSALFYAPNQESSQTTPMVSQAFYASYKNNRYRAKPQGQRRTSTGSSSKLNSVYPPLSNSVLSSSDTLPSFPTAHGLLSPETVMRMEDHLRAGRDEGANYHAVNMFLDRYKKEGPMACLPFLSDDEILPRLTQAMRDIL